MKKNDWILLGSFLLIAFIMYLFISKFYSQDAGYVAVKVDQVTFGTYPLNQDAKIDINGTNLLVIENGEVWMEEADCPDKLCMKQGVIKKSKETIICLPNKIVVQLIGTDESDMDAISK